MKSFEASRKHLVVTRGRVRISSRTSGPPRTCAMRRWLVVLAGSWQRT
jgi:hypothetical protein